MKEYPKIETVFNRDTEGTKKLIPYSWRDDTVKYLSMNNWIFTEKVDGTNVRVQWDGHEITFAGRTDKAQIPKGLQQALNDIFLGDPVEQLFEQMFGEKQVIFYGEGYGGKIQKVGPLYGKYEDFILFDIYMPEKDLWLKREDVESIAKAFDLNVVPIIFSGSIELAIDFVKGHPTSYINKNAPMEGVVGRPAVELKNREGERVIVKIKVKDFE